MCPHCGGEFKEVDRHIAYTQCNVPEHQREKKKTFMCEYCNKFFKSKANLSSHIKCIHREKNIFCDQCDYKTYAKNNLRYHIARVHERREVHETCQICSKRVTSMDWHIKTYHGDVKRKLK